MKKIALLLALVMTVTCFAACGNSTTTSTDASSTAASSDTATYRVLADGLEEEQYVIGFRKTDNALRNEVQKQLCEMKADGTAAKIATEWFGSDTTTMSSTYSGTDAADESLNKVKTNGKLVLGLDATFKPMGYTDESDNIVGFDIDLAKEVCKRIGVELELKGIDWETKEQTLDAGTIDCIWNGMSYSDERNNAMCLSDAYMNNSMVFTVMNSSSYKASAELSGKSVAVQSGSTAQEILEASSLASSITVVALGTNVECLQQLELGIVDAAFMDSVVANFEIKQK